MQTNTSFNDVKSSINRLSQKRVANARRGGFLQNRDGNIAILFVFMSTMLFLFVGGAIDYSRWNAVRSDMIESMDAASLAVAQLASADDDLSESQLQDYGRRFFEENFNYEGQLQSGWEINFDLSNKQFIGACVDGSLGTHLLGVAGIHKLDVDKCVEITKKGAGRIELALVLDITGSMNGFAGGERKIDSLKDGVDALLDVLFDDEEVSDNVRVGVVPFNQHVNPGGAGSWDNANWGDINANAFYHGYRFFHVDENVTIDMNTKVNHYRLYDSDPHNDWEGCMEARPYPLDELDTAPGSATTVAFLNDMMAVPTVADEPNTLVRQAFLDQPNITPALTLSTLASANNSRFVPMFLGDGPNCDFGACVYGGSGWVDGIRWYGYWFDDPDQDGGFGHDIDEAGYNGYINGDYVLDHTYTRSSGGVNFQNYVKVVNHFREVLQGNITDSDFEDWLDRHGATSYGAQEYILRAGYPGVWNPSTQKYEGKYELTKDDGPGPNYRCPEAILPLTATRDEIDGGDGDGGIMGDLSPGGWTNIPAGAIWGWRVVSPDAPFTEAIGPSETGPDGSVYEDWQKAVVIMTDGNNDFDDQDTHWGSDPTFHGYSLEERMGDGIDDADDGPDNMEDEADNKVLRICRRMKQENILVYTIVFDVNAGSTVENIFKACATKPTSPYFFNAPDGDDLEDAFKDIAADLVDLHVSK